MSNLDYNDRYWLGLPAVPTVGMIQLPSVAPDTGRNEQRAESLQSLISGGSSVVKAPRTKRLYTFSQTWLDTVDAATLRAFYSGIYGPAPYRLMDPNELNLLGFDASTAGLITSDISFWSPTSGSISSAIPYAPAPVVGTNSILWETSSNGQLNSVDSTITSIPAIPGVPYTFSCYARASVPNLMLGLYLIVGSRGSTFAQMPVANTTEWRRFSCTLSAGPENTQHVTPKLYLNGVTGLSDIQFCGMQVELGTEPTDYVLGLGAPAVVFSAGLTSTVPRTGRLSTAWNLAEI